MEVCHLAPEVMTPAGGCEGTSAAPHVAIRLIATGGCPGRADVVPFKAQVGVKPLDSEPS